MFCIRVYFRKKTFSKTELCREGLVDNVSVTSEGVDWITDEISHPRLFDLSENVLIKEDQIKSRFYYLLFNNKRNKNNDSGFIQYWVQQNIGLSSFHIFKSSSYSSYNNPSDCKKAKYVTLDFTNLCGLGCRIHQLIYCLQLALENERVFVLKNHHSGDPFREWLHQNMLPLSDKCSYLDSDGRSDNIECPLVQKAFTDPKWLPHALPIDMNEELLRLHEAPFVWFAGQLAAYILRPKPQLAQLINVTLKSFETSGDPVVGVHIRRTDKVDVVRI
ncbi:unnamed protein product [Schistosoma curassoni]|uniref:GT23 domain-containing protein n=1 Tax=Schistosoma curassoni TaxID=6186 RepID=A0A183KBG7_9TREM|nr:unnamed protein product [Schistosoma curassoni]